MQTEAAVLHTAGEPFAVEPVELDEPGDHEALIEIGACGVCHTDLHFATVGSNVPLVLGHEGAGTVVALGSRVSRVRVGDHIVTSMHACGRCRMCATARMHLCESASGATAPDRRPFRCAGGSRAATFAAGAFARHTVVHEDALVVVDADIPLEHACLLACGVTTGWGAAVHRGRVEPGETVVVWGAGGVGMAAIAGAVHAGAGRVVAADTSAWKAQQAMAFGATHHVVVAQREPAEIDALVREATGPRGADVAIITVGAITEAVFRTAIACLGRGGRLVTVAIGATASVPLPIGQLNVNELTIMGSLMGSTSPKHNIDQLVALYRAGRLDLDRFITARYPLDRINDACDDLLAGKNIRGVLV